MMALCCLSGGLSRAQQDSVGELPLSKDAITDIIHYKAKDSIALDLSMRQAFLYTNGEIEYQKMVLQADSVRVDFEGHTLSASGVPDSTGKVSGKPYFKQDGTEYHAETIVFNYTSQKGIISGVITQEGDGFLHGNKVKKISDSVMYLNGGKYTTCNYDHPHFALNFTKSKLIAGDKIITGPAYLTIEDVPTPLALPFAFFPITHERSSGVIIPSYGWMNGRGYYLRDGGYYFALGDYLDLSLLGEIYTNLSWSATARSNYYRRYRYKGSFDVRYGRTKVGLIGDTANYSIFSDYRITWKHDQDPKANPNSRFSADVNLQSRNYSKNTTNHNEYFNSTTTSSVSYTAQLGTIFNFAASARESFNAQTGIMDIKLPSVSLNSITFYPFRRKEPSGNLRWYENISMSYTLQGESNVRDSNLLQQNILSKAQYGVQHSVPISSSVKVLRFFNWTNSLSFNERWHWSTINKSIDSATNRVIIDTIQGFRANHDLTYTSSLSTRIYGMFNFKYGPMKALRHVINPSVSFNLHPNMGADCWREFADTTGYVTRYSIFEQSLYGGPSDGRSGRIAFNVGNNLEAKFKSFNDTVDELKKVTLIENLNFGMSYDLAKDSLNWSDFSITGRTTLFKNLILNYSGNFCPYVIDTLGRKHNQYLWDVEHHLFRRSNANYSAQLSYSLNNNTFKRTSTPNQGHPASPILQSPYNYNPALFMGSYVDFSVPWNLSLSYSLSYVTTYVARTFGYDTNIVQSINLSGNFTLTENWKVALSTGYDFVNKGISYTSLDIYRDLHCWEMRFNWVPFGRYRSWNFVINIKAPSLRDVKYEKRKSYLDNEGYYSY
ncbi:MAG: hypothetical protein MJZ51_05255 [Bacteroidales bacterium]|nr:hypothetical protein [Bacteroidales bacterium]